MALLDGAAECIWFLKMKKCSIRISWIHVQYFSNCMHKIRNLSYPQISDISRTKSHNFSRLFLQLSLCSLLKPGGKSSMKIKLEQRWQAVVQPNMSDQQCNCLQRCALYYMFDSMLQWNLSVATTSKIKCITFDLFSNVFWWILKVLIYSC